LRYVTAGFRGHASLTRRREEIVMARAGTHILDSGEAFPTLEMSTVKHGRIVVPKMFERGWVVFLLYRAHW
jgi:hypothetical protein